MVGLTVFAFPYGNENHACKVSNGSDLTSRSSAFVADDPKIHDADKVSLRMYNGWFLFFVLNATFSNISAILWRPILVVEEAGVPGENHRPWASNW
jgi:hypothetical protein